MGRSIAIAVAVAIVCALIVWALGRLLDSATLSSLAIAAGAGAGFGYLITTRMQNPGRGQGRDK